MEAVGDTQNSIAVVPDYQARSPQEPLRHPLPKADRSALSFVQPPYCFELYCASVGMTPYYNPGPTQVNYEQAYIPVVRHSSASPTVFPTTMDQLGPMHQTEPRGHQFRGVSGQECNICTGRTDDDQQYYPRSLGAPWYPHLCSPFSQGFSCLTPQPYYCSHLYPGAYQGDTSMSTDSRGDSFTSFLNPVQNLPQPSPSSTFSDSTAFSALSRDVNSSFSNTLRSVSSVGSVHHGEKGGCASDEGSCSHRNCWRTVPALEDNGPFMGDLTRIPSTNELHHGIQSDSTALVHGWRHQMMDAVEARSADSSRPWYYARTPSESRSLAGPRNIFLPQLLPSRPPSSFNSMQTSIDGSMDLDNSDRAASTSYSIGQNESSYNFVNESVEEPQHRNHDAITPSRETSPAHVVSNVAQPPRRKSPKPSRAGARRSTSKDMFLIRSRLDGMSYKDIKKKGGYQEAESTLRGRFRSLTKEKHKRVRRPRWTTNDIMLLKDAVSTLGTEANPRRRPQGRSASQSRKRSEVKVSWRKVSDYISVHGGSYQFGIGTCRKKWIEVSQE